MTYWKRGSNSGNNDEKPQQAKVERSKSFSVKCDKGTILFSNGNELQEGKGRFLMENRYIKKISLVLFLHNFFEKKITGIHAVSF